MRTTRNPFGMLLGLDQARIGLKRAGTQAVFKMMIAIPLESLPEEIVLITPIVVRKRRAHQRRTLPKCRSHERPLKISVRD